MTYEHIDEINAELSWAMRRGGLPEIDEQRDVQLRIQLNSIDDSLQALQEITHNDSRGFSPDPVCTVVTAGERAARQLGPPTHVDQSWITEEIAYRVTSELKAVGVAVMGAPRWERFDLTLETDTLVRAGKVATGMSVFVGIVIGEKAERNRYVPIPLANSKKFDGFATLIAFEHAANRLVPTEE